MTGPALLRVLAPGALATVQDLGRPGFQHLGVPVSGAADPVALRTANALCGNAPGDAALELTLGGLSLAVLAEAALALAGADLGAALDGKPLAPGTAFTARPGAVLSWSGRRSGCRAYLAVAGGVLVAPVLGSRSTYLPAGLGGLEGRALRAGDVLPAAPGVPPGFREGAWPFPDVLPRYALPGGPPLRLRAVPGPQDHAFTAEGLRTFFSGVFEVTGLSDRMGCRLSGPAVAHRTGPDVLSEGIALGSVQVPGDGQPIVLLADRQTTGGYAKIATVATPDLPLLAQAVPGDRVRFEEVDLWSAREAFAFAEYRFRAAEEQVRSGARTP